MFGCLGLDLVDDNEPPAWWRELPPPPLDPRFTKKRLKEFVTPPHSDQPHFPISSRLKPLSAEIRMMAERLEARRNTLRKDLLLSFLWP
jgi:hypothetical protein